MPTFKNDTTRYIDYEAFVQDITGEAKKILIRFKPGEERPLPFWLPYQQLGLTLTSADYPAVPSKILISGTFLFTTNSMRKFNIEPCVRYVVNIIVQKGKVKFYAGSSTVAQEVAEDANVPYRYRSVFGWENAPYIRLVCDEGEAEVSLSVEVCTNELSSQRTGDETTWH